MRKVLGPYLKKKRLDAGLTQRELAMKIDATKEHICMVESGAYLPKMSALGAWVHEVGATKSTVLNYIMGDYREKLRGALYGKHSTGLQ